MTAMNVVPLVVGLLLGVGLVGREIEGGTAPTVWALAGSRRRWLLGRLVPILVILVALLAFIAIATELLAAARVPWQFGRPSFDDAGLHGPGVIARGVAAFGLALAVGAWSGRMLPTILISSLLALFLGIGGYFLLDTWVDANAHEIAVPSWFNGEYDGGKFTGWFYRLPDGPRSRASADSSLYAGTGRRGPGRLDGEQSRSLRSAFTLRTTRAGWRPRSQSSGRSASRGSRQRSRSSIGGDPSD